MMELPKAGCGRPDVRWLKADLHAHCGDDPQDPLGYSAEMLIDAAAQVKMDVLAIACHERLVYTPWLAAYAARRAILLVPAIELRVEGRHLLVLNPDAEQAAARTFAQLRALGRRQAVLVAPHPFYPSTTSLGRELARNVDLFDAVEYCHFYYYGWNLNRKAVQFAQQHRLPLLGTSDAHGLPYSDSTFAWVEAEPTVEGVVRAVRAGRVRLESTPRPLRRVMEMVYFSGRHGLRDIVNYFWVSKEDTLQ